MQQDDHRRTSRGLGWLFLAATVFQVLQSVAFDLLGQKGIEPPVEILLVFSELSILVPTLIYILVKKLGFRDDLGFKKIKAGTFFMCILLTLLVMPVASFFQRALTAVCEKRDGADVGPAAWRIGYCGPAARRVLRSDL